MRVLITGANGMLGSDLCPVFRRQHQVLATDIDDMDVRDPGHVGAVVTAFRPDAVVHLAALTDVDYCEREPAEALRTNFAGTQNVARACRDAGAVMVYVSTISVFDGHKREPYVESDIPNPQSAYSRAKFCGEQAVRAIVPSHFVVRTGWLFGGGNADKKFVAKILELASTRPELKVVDDKLGSPTYTVDLAHGIAALLSQRQTGLYHLVNAGGCVSRYQVACTLLRLAGIATCAVVPVPSSEFPLPAPRPDMEAALNDRLDRMELRPMRDWRAALQEYVRRLAQPARREVAFA